MGVVPFLSLADVPAESVLCPASEASFYMLTLYHQYYGPILLVGKTGTGFRLPSHHIWWDSAGNLGEALERLIVVPPTWGQIDLSYQKPILASLFYESAQR